MKLHSESKFKSQFAVLVTTVTDQDNDDAVLSPQQLVSILRPSRVTS